MSREQKNNWKPSATLDALHLRAKILAIIRQYFAAAGVLEVETPLLCETSVTDPYINSIDTPYGYLQTSPEYAMKRLLAAGSGSIYQICKAFRKGDQGQIHHPEFTMLEWYRTGYNHDQLMDDMNALLKLTLNTKDAERISYQLLFESYLDCNPHTATLSQLRAIASQHQLSIASEIDDCTTWLQLLMSHCIEPHLGKDKPVFIYDFPVEQAALARIMDGKAARFEVYYRGLELANGFYELSDANEQRKRFEENLNIRALANLPPIPIDESFLAALYHGLPECSGVALGLDRLVMLAGNYANISDVVSFT